MLLDSNIIIGAAKPGGEFLIPVLRDPKASLSIVTRIESLGFHQLAADEEAQIRESIALLAELPLDEDIAERAITLRQKKRMKLGDAIIAATALEYGLALVTRNTTDFDHIGELKLINPFASLP
jgi:predicted nucleic acid-binding protein